MSYETERMQILEMIESGKITPSEGLQLLEALTSRATASTANRAEAAEVILPPAPPAAPLPPETSMPSDSFTTASASPAGAGEEEIPQPASPPPPAEEPLQGEVLPGADMYPPDMARFRRWWQIPFWVGVGITVIGGLLIYAAWEAYEMSFWFACAWFPFMLGVAMMALAWGSHNLPWLHLRIQQKPGERPQRIAISFPIPIRLVSWGLRTFGHKIPEVDKVKGLDEMLTAVGKTTPDNPLSIEVDEGEDGEKVRIYIG